MQTEDHDRISPIQIFGLIALTALNMQDGFDILAISYASTDIMDSWGISRTGLGLVLSASLFGMMIGAVVLSPLADKFGRRTIAAWGLAISGCGMLLAMVSWSVEALLIGRMITGLGIGAILASVNTLVAEYAGEKYVGIAVGIFLLGFPLGAFLSGYLADYLLETATWRHLFAFGAISSFVFVPIVLVLPESMSYIAQRGGPGALERINKIRAKLGRDPIDALPETEASITGLQGIAKLFSRGYLTKTILIWTGFFLLLSTLYFLLSWLPRLFVEIGFSEADGNRAERLINLIGMPGILLIGALSLFVRSSLVTGFYLAALALSLFVLASVSGELAILLLVVAAVGFFLHGGMIGLYSIVPYLYPSSFRATGTGWAIGMSRFGAVVGPYIAGVLLDAGWSPQDLFRLYVLPVLAASVCAFALYWVTVREAR
jgi:benzoate transport